MGLGIYDVSGNQEHFNYETNAQDDNKGMVIKVYQNFN